MLAILGPGGASLFAAAPTPAPDLLLGQADALRDAQALVAVAHVALAFTPAVSPRSPPRASVSRKP